MWTRILMSWWSWARECQSRRVMFVKNCQKLWLSILASLLPWIHQWLGWQFLHIHMTSWWGKNERKRFFPEHMFSLYGNWCQGKWILSLAWYSHQSCPVHSAGGQGFMSWVNCTLRSERRKIILCMFFLLLRCELGRAFSSNNICFHAFFHAFTVACGRTSE